MDIDLLEEDEVPPPTFPIECMIEGRPIPLKRHRTTKTGHRYDPSARDKADFLDKVRATGSLPAQPLFEPLCMELLFEMPRAKSHFGTGRNAGKLKQSAPRFHTKVPDVDNLCKFVLDALNKYMYKDDSCIVKVICEKRYTSALTAGRTCLRITRCNT